MLCAEDSQSLLLVLSLPSPPSSLLLSLSNMITCVLSQRPSFRDFIFKKTTQYFECKVAQKTKLHHGPSKYIGLKLKWISCSVYPLSSATACFRTREAVKDRLQSAGTETLGFQLTKAMSI
ncbi:hypothetical protein V8C43DRAFT_242109 [Trichoderma afarasin]